MNGSMRPRLFVGSSREALDVCRAIQAELAGDCDVTVWDQDVFRLTHGALESLLDVLDSSDAGVFVLQPDDLTERRGEAAYTVRDNVLFELGMFIGRLGRDRAFMIRPDGADLRLPSDIADLTTAVYSADFFADAGQAAVGAACTKIRKALGLVQVRMAPEPAFQARLDRAMRRMSNDLGQLLSAGRASPGEPVTLPVSLRLGPTVVRVELGRIQDYPSSDTRTAIALPANEYFDDECITDRHSSLGAFVQHHFPDRVKDFLRRVGAALTDAPSQRVPRAERRIGESYGIGKAILVGDSDHRLILVSATTERTGIGLRAEPHFLYAALEGVAEVMNENRINSLTMPVFGSGHGGMPLSIAILFNLMAVRSILTEDVGRKLREVRIVVFEGNANDLDDTTMRDIVAHVHPA